MFVRNPTDREIVCKRDHIDFEKHGVSLRFANVMTVDCYRLVNRSWRLATELPVPQALHACFNATAWDGTSVTASGAIAAPPRGKLAQRVGLRVGEIQRTLVARAARRWLRQRDKLVLGTDEEWQPMALDWSQAFGGSVEMPAGKDPISGLPRPAFVGMHPQNPIGKGFAPEDRAEGLELPRLELLEDQLTRFGELPIPGCFAACGGRLSGLTARIPEKHPLAMGSYRSLLAPHHVAPAFLIMPWLATGTQVHLNGVETELRFELPTSTLKVRARSKHPVRQGTRLRAINLDADAQSVTCVWQHAVVTKRATLPDLEIEYRGAAP